MCLCVRARKLPKLPSLLVCVIAAISHGNEVKLPADGADALPLPQQTGDWDLSYNFAPQRAQVGFKTETRRGDTLLKRNLPVVTSVGKHEIERDKKKERVYKGKSERLLLGGKR